MGAKIQIICLKLARWLLIKARNIEWHKKDNRIWLGERLHTFEVMVKLTIRDLGGKV
jgi:hypothetical protein